MRWLRSLVLAAWVVSLGFSGSAAAEGPDTYGTASRSVYMIPSFHFLPWSNLTTSVPSLTQPLGRYSPDGAVLRATANLPNGARVERIELNGCDTEPSRSMGLELKRFALQGAVTLDGVVGTHPAESTPGCGNFSLELLNPFNVNNQNEVVVVDVFAGPTDTTNFSAVRIYYRLRVSPAPAVATFPNDVPTNHPFFQFIEALAAAGITAGCGPGSFCPAQPVTRGEMAVFLAAALGLHFPN